MQARDWTTGVYMAATLGSETTAAAAGKVGQVRRDPMAMLPFCGYNIGDYFKHWLAMESLVTSLPAVFGVNWFRLDENGKFIWPGYGENMRVLKWIFERSSGTAGATESVLGWIPEYDGLDWTGLDSITRERFDELVRLDPLLWLTELDQQAEFFQKLGDKLPPVLAAARADFARAFAHQLTA